MGRTLRRQSIANIAPNGYAITEEYSCPNSEVTAQRDELVNSVHNVVTGMTAPVCHKVITELHGYRDGEARLTAFYQTLNWSQWLYQNHNKAIVFRKRIQSDKSYRRDLDDVLIEGQDEDSAADRTWVVDAGENFGIRPKHFLLIRAVVDDEASFKAYDGKQGHINSIAMRAVANDIAPGHLLFTGVNVTPVLADTDLWLVEYGFLHHHLLWNEQCITKQYERIFKKFPVYGYYEAIGGTFVSDTKFKWLTAPTGETHTVRLFESADFSAINAMCE